MIIRRLGNKTKVAKKIIAHFPEHECYFETFFGAGGMFFNKRIAKYNYLNDLDSDIFNLYYQIEHNKDAFYHAIEMLPYHKTAWDWIKTLKTDCKMMQAVRFIVLSNFGYMGKPETLKFEMANSKQILLENIEKTYDFLVKNKNVQFNNADFRDFLKQWHFRNETARLRTFIYNDPPYLGTDNNYNTPVWTESDFEDLVKTNIETRCRFAISEFDNEFVLDCAEKYKLNCIVIGERLNLKNRRVEVLLTNYKTPQNKLF